MKAKLRFSFILMMVFSLANAATPPNATIYYSTPVCIGSGLVTPTITGTTGGTFSASPAGLSINPVTGIIDPSTSVPGTYTISYSIPPDQTNPAFEYSVLFTVVGEPNPGADGIMTVCEDPTITIDLYSVISGEDAGGTWTRFSGTGGVFNAAAGTFTPSNGATTSQFSYSVQTGGPCATFPSTATITINPVMVPIFGQVSALCQGATPPTLPTFSANGISGTWNPSVINTQIAGTYNYTFTPDLGLCAVSQSLTVTVVPPTIFPTFTFPTAIGCSTNAPVLPTTSDNGTTGTWYPPTITETGIYMFTPDPGQCATTIAVSFVLLEPQATIAGSTTVCSGSSATVTFTGTPNSIVSYTVNSGAMQTIVLNAAGMATITTPMLNVSTAICLVSVTSGSCTTGLSGCAIITVALSVVIPPMPDVVECGQYILPTLPIGNYHTEPNGGGTMLEAGDAITNTQLIYVYLSGPCSSNEESFVVSVIPIVNPTISTVDNINFIIVEGDQIVQPLQLNTEVQSGNYSYQWMETEDIPGANSPSYTVNNLVTGGEHYYSVRITNNDTSCVTQSLVFQVFEIPVPAPIGDPNQTFILGQTLADIIVSGQNIQWYNVFNRNATSNPLPLNTPLVEGVTYYATQTINGYESTTAFEITIQFLANNTFAFKDLKFNPNPVQDVLHIQSKDLIEDVTVFNIMGQKIFQQNFESLDLRLQLSQLKAGNYFVKLESDNKSQVIKVIKN